MKSGAEYRDDIFLKEVGLNIKNALKSKKITQEIFYIDTGINPNRIISGKTNISVCTLKRVSDYLDIPVSQLVLTKNEKND